MNTARLSVSTVSLTFFVSAFPLLESKAYSGTEYRHSRTSLSGPDSAGEGALPGYRRT